MTRYSRLLLILFATLLTIACGISGPLSQLRLGTTEGAPEPSPTARQFVIEPASAGDGLDQLNSYRANVSLDFEGSRNGEPTAGHIEWLTEVTQEPPARYQYFEASLSGASSRLSSGVAEFFKLDDQIYLKKAGDELWRTFSDAQGTPEQFVFFEFERLIVLPPTVSTPPRIESLNGLSVEHYVFSERDLSQPNIIFEQAQGDLWLAVPDNYLVQYAISATLRMASPNPNADLFDQGHLDLRYTLTDINADLTISPPANAVGENETLNSLPRLPDAQIISVFPTLIEYTSAITPISATLFYREQLSALEWSEEQATIFNEKAQLRFARDNQALTIIITPGDEADQIKVLLDLGGNQP